MEAYWDVDLQAEVRPRSEHQYVGGRRIATTLGIRVLGDGSEDRSSAVTTEYIYDDQGRAIATRLPNGQASYIEYNLAGQMIAETNDAGHRIQYEYNETGAMTAIVLPLVIDGSGDAYHPRTEFQYDDWGNRVVTRTGIAQRLDGSFDLTTLRESRDSYTDAGKLVSIARGDSLTETRGYDALGQIEYRHHSNGIVQAYRWSTDPLQPGLDATEFYRSWQDYQMQEPAIDVHKSDKDWLGNTTQQYATGTTYREYDGAGRLLAVRNDAGMIQYEYSLTGQLKAAYTIVEANQPEVLANRVEYEYDRAGRLSRAAVVARNGQLLTTPLVYQYAYDVFGKIRQLVHPDGTIELHEYDALQRNTGVSYLGADQTPSWQDNQPIAVFQYSLDEVGHKAEIVERFYDVDSGLVTSNRTIRNWHDAVGRLVTVEQQDGDERTRTHFDYDAAHNRIAQRVDIDQDGTIDWRIEYQYDTVDRLLFEHHFTGDLLSQSTSYDYNVGSDRPALKVKRDAVTDRVLSETRFDYDVQGYLTLVEAADYGTETLVRRVERSYDPSGNLVAEQEVQSIDGVTVHDEALRMLVDELSPTGYPQLFEIRSDTDGDLHAAFISGHRVLGESTAGVTRSLLVDGTRSTRLTRDLSNGDMARSDFSPFGELLGREPRAVGAYHGFSGELQDRENDLMYLRKRTYAPSLGRFLQADTFAGLATEPTSLNRYIYASNAPYTFRDPSGNLFVLFDGTWNHDVEAELEEGEAFTNVVGLRDAYDVENIRSRYIYQRGVGNKADNGFIMSFLGGAFGLELTRIKNEAIALTMFALDPQFDQLYITGFSRGSITALQYAHDIERLIPEAKVKFMGIYDPVASVGFPGNGVNIGFNVSLANNVKRAYTLVSYQEDRGFFPGTNLHTRRAYQEVTWGVHSDVGGGYGTDPLAIIQDALYKMRRQFQSQGLMMAETGIPCSLCNGKTTHHPHPLKTYMQHGGQTYGEIGRPMVEFPMSGELGLAFFFDEMNFSRVGMTAAEARAAQTIWIPMRISQIYNLAEEFVQIPLVGRAVTATYMAWNLGALHQSHIYYALNRI
jgi:RHS repeat-associated protein